MLTSLWSDFLTNLQDKNQKNPILHSLLKQVRLKELTEKKILIVCENIGSRLYLERRKGVVEELIGAHFKKGLGVEFVLEEKKIKKEAPLFQFQPLTEDGFTRAGLNIKYKFDNFAVSTSNQVAFAASKAVASSPGKSYNPLFFHGGVGVGKKHLAQAIARQILDNNHKAKILFCPSDQFTNELIEAIQEKGTAKFRRKFRPLNLLVLDDVQFIGGKQTVQEEFFHTFNTIVSAGGQIILTSDRPLSHIKGLEDRLRSRFSGGLIVDIQAPDFELRTAILLIKAREKGVMIDMEAAKIISESVSDTRALEGALLSLCARVVGKSEKIDLEAVEDFFAERRKQPSQKKISPNDVIKTTCSYYNIRQSHIKSASRSSAIALTRQIIMFLLRTELQLKLEEIAYILKRKDHTTVMHGADKIKRLIIKDASFREGVDTIVRTLRSST